MSARLRSSPKSGHVPALLALAMLLLGGCETLAPKPPGMGPPVSWSDLPGWSSARLSDAWPVLLSGCGKLPARSTEWATICADATLFPEPDEDIARAFFETRFVARAVYNPEGGRDGLITGYYEPLLHGSRTRDTRYRYPIYRVPDDLVTVELGELYPELRHRRVRGRLDGRRVVPYFDRATIENGRKPLAGNELLWVDDPIALFFLQIQGSGKVRLPSGETLNIGYAEQNGHPYVAIGNRLVEMGVLKPEEVELQTIRAWLVSHPAEAGAIMQANPSYVFFAERDPALPGPLGALGVPLSPERAVAVDPRYIALGSPVWLDTTLPGAEQPYRQLAFAFDTGGAIKGPVRADLFFGFGEAAEASAGRMKQPGTLYVLTPADRSVD